MIEIPVEEYKEKRTKFSIVCWNLQGRLTFDKNSSIQCINFGSWFTDDDLFSLKKFRELLFLRNIQIYHCKVNDYIHHHFVYYRTRKDLENIIQVMEILLKKEVEYAIGTTWYKDDDNCGGYVKNKSVITRKEFFKTVLFND